MIFFSLLKRCSFMQNSTCFAFSSYSVALLQSLCFKGDGTMASQNLKFFNFFANVTNVVLFKCLNARPVDICERAEPESECTNSNGVCERQSLS